jgi:hypothetical protein
MMTLTSFLELLNKNKKLPETSVIYFVGNEYPLLFFSHIFSFLQKNNNIFEFISLDSMDVSFIKSQVSTISFTGSTVYCFNDFHTLSLKKQQEWIVYFKTYTGPHKLIFFCNEQNLVPMVKDRNHITTISLPHEVSLQDISMIRFLVDSADKKYAPMRTGLQVQMISLDTLVLLHHYELVVGKNWDSFLQEWGPYILEPTSSLFLLSQYFFGKKTHLFFTQWAHSFDFYLPTFWPTFWADQIWRAYMYCDLMRQKKYAEAKKVQYKLPYSLINRDWSSLSLQELQKAHDYLCTLDYRLKNGCSSAALELFFDKFFEGKFR